MPVLPLLGADVRGGTRGRDVSRAMVGAESRGCAARSFSFRKRTTRGLSSQVLARPTLATAAVNVAHGARGRKPLQVVLSLVLLTISDADLDVRRKVEALSVLVYVRKLLAGLHTREAGRELGNVRADATDRCLQASRSSHMRSAALG
eukprot:282733-Rhodomonas_salina.1